MPEFKCLHCLNEFFTSFRKFKLHNRQRHKRFKTKCPHCHNMFLYQVDLTKHLDEVAERLKQRRRFGIRSPLKLKRWLSQSKMKELEWVFRVGQQPLELERVLREGKQPEKLEGVRLSRNVL